MIGDKIKAARESVRGFKDRQWLADEVGVSRQAVNDWENNRYNPSLPHLLKVARVCGVSLDDLVENDQGGEEGARG
jgi:DNA-binding XRE family transcriptional regulator